MNVKIDSISINWSNQKKGHIFEVGKVVEVRKNNCNFTEVFVKFSNGDSYWFSSSYLRITAEEIK